MVVTIVWSGDDIPGSLRNLYSNIYGMVIGATVGLPLLVKITRERHIQSPQNFRYSNISKWQGNSLVSNSKPKIEYLKVAG